MKVKYNIKKSLKDTALEVPSIKHFFKRWDNIPDSFEHLTFGKEYTVYGLSFSKERFEKYMIVDDTEVFYPMFYPVELFEVIDTRISKYWHGINNKFYPILNIDLPKLITFKEAKVKFFFDKLIDGDKDTQETFLKYKRLMDNEFPDEELKEAEIIEGNWVFCAYCYEAWESNSELGIIECPKCFNKNNSPLWKGLD